MRKLTVHVPRGDAHRALDIAQAHGAVHLSSFPATAPDRPIDVVELHVDNAALGPVLDDLQELDGLEVSFAPGPAIALQPPPDAAADQVKDVSPRSPLEIFLDGIQSVGSWGGFLGYAAAAGVVVWIGLYGDSIFLLVAAMLIAPFAGPAMNLALGTARGDATLLGRSVVRYAASLAVTIAVAWLLSTLVGQEVATRQMTENSLVTALTLLLPLTAGAVGALHLAQSERSSLVTAAGTGVLVAASLAPPAGLTGMALAMGEWELVRSAAFVMVAQLVGINLAGAVVFRLFGLTPRGVRYSRGLGWLRAVSLGATAAALGALVVYQLASRPDHQQSSVEQRIVATIHDVVARDPRVSLIDAEARFTRADVPGAGEPVLITVYVERDAGEEVATRGDPELARDLEARLGAAIAARHGGVRPLVDVTVLRATPPR